MIEITVAKESAARNDLAPALAVADSALKLGNLMVQAVCGRNTYPAGTTVGDFIAALRALGIRDSDPLDSIEYGVALTGIGVIEVDRADGGGIEIREIR